jgi:Zn-dependent protease with chaperone function
VKLFLHATVLMLLLFGLVAAAFNGFLRYSGEPPWMPILFTLVIFGLHFGYGPRIIEWLFDIEWDDEGKELPAGNQEFLRQLCTDRGLKMPRIGVIRSDSPNAFTFGRFPGDARVVVTTGLLRLLNTEETNAVLAHEMGHVERWDFVVMTVAALAPLLLYELYRASLRVNQSGDGGGGGANQNKVPCVAEISYLCYKVSQFLVLLLSRTREYYADRYAARVTRTPNALASALVKISYGMAKVDGEFQHAMQDASPGDRASLSGQPSNLGATALMGICSLQGGGALALGGTDARGAAAMMRWDLVNPWARLYELNSTHPLTALRIQALNAEAEPMHQRVAYPLPEGRQRQWRTFPVEALLWAMPWLAAGAFLLAEARHLLWFGTGIHLPLSLARSLVVLTGVSWMCRTWFRYYGTMQPATIAELFQDVQVSEMRPRAVRVEGKILGFGVPGSFWSPDLVLQDASGMLYVWYRASIPFGRLVFALASAKQYIGQRVAIEGWFRRGPSPYLEMSCLTGEDGKPRRAYSRHIQYCAAALIAAGGLLLMR